MHLGAILNDIEELTKDPRPPGFKKLTGQERFGLHQGRYRIVSSIQDDELTVWVA
jgi:mRNA-degrading endonuclease RelE of RelBE toxin-antitoxin system